MPAPTPRTMRAGMFRAWRQGVSSRASPRRTAAGPGSPAARSTGASPARGSRPAADVLQQALAELGVVGVDLPRPLGRHDDEAVLAVDDVEQVVDGRVGDAVRSGIACHRLPSVNVFPARSGRHQGYQLLAHVLDRRVDKRYVELLAGLDLRGRQLQPAGDDLGRLGAPAGEAPYQLVPGGRGEEDQQRVRHRPAHLPGPGDVDLQQRRDARRDATGDGLTRRTVTVTGEAGPLEQIATFDHGVEGLVADEVVFAAVHLAR